MFSRPRKPKPNIHPPAQNPQERDKWRAELDAARARIVELEAEVAATREEIERLRSAGGRLREAANTASVLVCTCCAWEAIEDDIMSDAAKSAIEDLNPVLAAWDKVALDAGEGKPNG